MVGDVGSDDQDHPSAFADGDAPDASDRRPAAHDDAHLGRRRRGRRPCRRRHARLPVRDRRRAGRRCRRRRRARVLVVVRTQEDEQSDGDDDRGRNQQESVHAPLMDSRRPIRNPAEPPCEGAGRRSAQDGVGETADGDRAAAACKRLQEAHRVTYFGSRRPAVRFRLVWSMRVGRDRVPEQHLLLEVELGEHALDDRRRRLGRPAPGELAF